MEKPTCKTCPFFFFLDENFNEVAVTQKDVDEGYEGECRRLPPVFTASTCYLPHMPPRYKGDDGVYFTRSSGWPDVLPFNWCGEHPDFPAYLKVWRATRREQPIPELYNLPPE